MLQDVQMFYPSLMRKYLRAWSALGPGVAKQLSTSAERPSTFSFGSTPKNRESCRCSWGGVRYGSANSAFLKSSRENRKTPSLWPASCRAELRGLAWYSSDTWYSLGNSQVTGSTNLLVRTIMSLLLPVLLLGTPVTRLVPTILLSVT